MFTEAGHGVPEKIWDHGGPALRRLPDGGQAESLTPALQQACVQYARSKWPEEALSALVRHPDGSVGHYPLTNVDPSPEDTCTACPHELVSVMERGDIVAVHHSHPNADPLTGDGLHPSARDIEMQLEWGVPFYITVLSVRGGYMDFFGWGDQLPIPPIRKRYFRNGVTDCYALVRHMHFLHSGQVMPDGPRHMGWWNDKEAENPITSNMHAAGFREVLLQEVQPFDDLLFAISGQRINHCGVYIGGDLFAHHLHGRLSRVDPLPQWRRYLSKVMRYDPEAVSEERR